MPSIVSTPVDSTRVGTGFISLYALSYMGLWLALMAPVLVTLPLKISELVGPANAPGALGLVAGVGALLAMVGNPFFGKLSDRTVSRFGMRRPWMIIGLVGGSAGLLVVALAQSIPVVIIGWSLTQLGLNALLAAQIAVVADQIPERQRGTVSGILGICPPRLRWSRARSSSSSSHRWVSSPCSWSPWPSPPSW